MSIINRAISNPLDSQYWFDTPTWQLLQILFWDSNIWLRYLHTYIALKCWILDNETLLKN